MNWITFVVVTVVLDALRIFIDNYTSDVYFKGNGAVGQKLFYGYIWIIISLIVLAVTGFNIFEAGTSAFWFLLSGVIGSIASIWYYKALEIEDSTNLGIFIQLSPVLYLILGWFFLGETITVMQFIGLLVILSAPIMIVLNARKRSRKIKLKAVFYAFLYVLVAIIGNLLFVKFNVGDIHFIHEMSLVFLGAGITSVIIVYTKPKWRKRFWAVVKSSKKKVFLPMSVNAVASLVKSTTYRAALVVAPTVSIASAATDSVLPIVIFFMGIVLTLIWPKFGREKLNRKTVLIHLVATVLVLIGIVMVQSQNV